MKKLLWIIPALCTFAIAQDNPFELYSLSQQAFARGDTASYVKYAKEARELAPFDLWFSANLARAFAMTNQKIRCIEILEDLSVLGFDFDVKNDEGFRNIWTHSLLKNFEKTIRRNTPKEAGTVAFTITEEPLQVGTLTHDLRKNIFYLAGTPRRPIVALYADGSTFGAVPGAEESMPVPLALKVDASRNQMWAADSLLHRYDLETMTRRASFIPDDTLGHRFNDLVVLRNSDIFLTDGTSGRIYTVHRDKGILVPWFESDEMVHPKGITVSHDQQYLFVAHWRGISRISLANKTSVVLPAKVKTTMTGVDGLYFHDGGLIAIQNNAGPQSRIMRFDLNTIMDAVTKATILESDHPLYGVPAAGAVIGDDLYYVASSRMKNFDRDENTMQEKQSQPTYILKLPLKK